MAKVTWNWDTVYSRLLPSQSLGLLICTISQSCMPSPWPGVVNKTKSCPQGAHALFYRANKTQTQCGDLSNMSSSLTVSIPRMNPQPPAKDLEHRKYSELLVPETNPSSLPLLGRLSLSASSPDTHLLPLHYPANPWEVPGPSLTRLVLGPPHFSRPCRPRLSPKSQAARPGCNLSPRASETTGIGESSQGKQSTPRSSRAPKS